MSKELIVLEEIKIVPFFVNGDHVDQILKSIEQEALAHVPDVSTKKGRDAIKANVTKVTKCKTFLEKNRKNLSAEYKEIPKKIDATGRRVNDFLNDLQAKARIQLTEWEVEEARKEEEARILAIKEEDQKQRDADHELALAEYKLHLYQVGEARLAAEKQAEIDKAENERLQKERDERIATEAKAESERQLVYQQEKAKRDAEEYERKLAAAAEAEKQAAVYAEQKRIDDIAREEQRIIDQKAAMEAAEKRAAEQERKRLAQIKADEEAQAAARERNVEHKRKVNIEILNAICTECGFSEEEAKAVIMAIASRKIPHVSIQY